MTHRLPGFATPLIALAALAAAPLSAFAHAGTDDGGHHGFLLDSLQAFVDTPWPGTVAAVGLSLALAAAAVRQRRAFRAARAKGVGR